MLLPRFGCDVTLAHPAGYRLMDECLEAGERGAAEGDGGFRVVDDMDAAFDGADVVYPKSWGPYDLMRERAAAYLAKDEATIADTEQRALAQNAQFTDWICDEQKMARTAGGEALYMHCLPADIGAEVSEDVFDRYRTRVAREANKKVYAIMALLAGAKVGGLANRLNELASRRRRA
jgi:ornithine carbamoyltransferase